MYCSNECRDRRDMETCPRGDKSGDTTLAAVLQCSVIGRKQRKIPRHSGPPYTSIRKYAVQNENAPASSPRGKKPIYKKYFLPGVYFLKTGTTKSCENQCKKVLVPCGFYGLCNS